MEWFFDHSIFMRNIWEKERHFPHSMIKWDGLIKIME